MRRAGTHPDNALRAPVSDPAGIERLPKRAGSEIGAPPTPAEHKARCLWGQCADVPLITGLLKLLYPHLEVHRQDAELDAALP
jgi:hypothetical protein